MGMKGPNNQHLWRVRHSPARLDPGIKKTKSKPCSQRAIRVEADLLWTPVTGLTAGYFLNLRQQYLRSLPKSQTSGKADNPPNGVAPVGLILEWLVKTTVNVLCAKLLQLCPTLSDSMGYSSPGSSVHGSLQARMLEWVAIPPGGLPNPGTEPMFLKSPALASGFSTTSTTWEAPIQYQ